MSDRPADANDKEPDADIWRFSLDKQHRLEHLSVNSNAREYSPIVTASGALYFASDRDGAAGRGDLYRAAPITKGFQTPEALGPALNSPTGEWNLWVSADETEVVFEASSRPTNLSVPGDLYYSWLTRSGWTAAMPVQQLNSTGSDLMPRLHPDSQTLYYTTAPIGGHASIKSTAWGPLRTELRDTYAPMLLVANRSSHEVTFVDLSLGEVVARLPTGEGPHLLSNVSKNKVLATGFGEFPRPHTEPVTSRPPFVESLNSRLTLIDTTNRTALLDTVIKECTKPHASWIIAEHAYVTCEPEERVLVLNLKDGSPITHFDTKQEGSHVLSFDQESRTLASSNTDSGSITLIDIDSGESRIVKLAAGSEGAISVAGHFWVGNAFDGSVSVVDAHTGSVAAHIDSVCGFPISFSQDHQQQLWVACFGSAELVSLGRDDFSITRRISLHDQPLNLLMHPTRELAYVSLPRKNAVAEVDILSGMEIRRITVGIEPDGLRWATPDR